jgi:Ca2+-binding EF-hand superfamily protein
MLNKSRKRAVASCAVLFVLGSSAIALADDMVSFATGGYARALRTQEMMDKIDANADHMVSKAEWDEYQQKSFAMMDADGSGVLDHDEFMNAKAGEMVAFATGGYARALRSKEMHAKIDADGDGKVTRVEFSAFQDKVFASMDTSNQLLVGNYQFFGEPVRN